MFEQSKTPSAMSDKTDFDLLLDGARVLQYGAGSNRRKTKRINAIQREMTGRGIEIILKDNPDAVEQLKKEMSVHFKGDRGHSEKWVTMKRS